MWDQTGSVGFSGAEIRYPCMAIDKNGVPYIAYQEYDSEEAVVKKFNGTNWVNVGAPGFSEGTATGLSLAFDQSGTPYLSYTSGLNGEDSYMVIVKKFNGTRWVTVGETWQIGEGDEFTSLAIKKDGTIYVAYRDAYDYSAARVKKFNGTSWVLVGGKISLSSAIDISLAINEKDGFPYIAYCDRYNLYNASVKKFNGSSWVSVGPASLTSYGAGFTSLAIDKTGVPFLAYVDWNSYNINVRKFDGTNWVWVGKPDFGEGDVEFVSLALDENGLPYVAFRDWNTDRGKASVSRFNGTKWSFVGSAGFTSGPVENIAMAIDTVSGTAYLAYEDIDNDRYANVMNFSLSALPVNLSDFKAKQIGSTSLLTWATSSELNNDRFEVQRSIDGIRFSTIGTVKGKSNSKMRVDYSFTDYSPVLDATNYYRLNQIDKDGRAVLSKINALQFGQNDINISIYPNPATQYLKVSSTKKYQKVTLEIYDVQGSAVWKNVYSNPANPILVDIQKLPAGTYQLILKDEKGNSYSERFMKQ